MIPSAANSDYPIFVANQVLTNDNLNDLFGYLDEQERITRTNLIGMGIVCGLQIKTDPTGNSIAISKGVGVTSSGYIVSVPEREYKAYKSYDAVKPVYYNKFVAIDSKIQLLNLWELKQQAAEEGTTPLDNTFLSNKIVLLFVELLEENSKNCDPESCDDKGAKVTVTFRPLLADRNDVDALLSNISNNTVLGKSIVLPQIKMPRYDVASTLLLDTEDVFNAYEKQLSAAFIESVQKTLSDAWGNLSSLMTDDFPIDPFTSLSTDFNFLHDGTISNTQLLNIQYYYDLFSDIILAYDELRIKAYDTVCECLPDESLFPRHLLLGEAIGFDDMNSNYRTRFISSPVLCCCADDAKAVKSLFKRIVLIIEKFEIPGAATLAFNQKQLDIKITPSLLGKDPLSEKAIPFYYDINTGTAPLYLNWNIQRSLHGTASQILSYKSKEYNTSDDFVMNPLKYDIEPNNFLRIEGHIGQDYRTVLAQLDQIKKENRLPFDVVALSSDTRSIFEITDALTTMDTSGSITAAFEIMIKNTCCFADIFLALDQWINRLSCCLADQKKYYLAQPSFVSKSDIASHLDVATHREAVAFDASASSTVKETAESTSANTIGELYAIKQKEGTINNQFCTDVFVNIATGNAAPGSALVMMPYRIDGMLEVLPAHITALDSVALESKYADLTGTSTQLRTMYTSPNVAGSMIGVDPKELSTKLEMNCLVCLFQELQLLVREFLIRLLSLMIKQKLGYYTYTNPGIQHKAGVTIGGTFIIVYHEQAVQKQGDIKSNFTASLKEVKRSDGTSESAYYSNEQPLLSSVLLLDEFLFLQKVNEVPVVPNEILDPIINQIKTGVVIADFYVPYICCSDCAATQMMVLPTTEERNLAPIAKASANPVVVTLSANGEGSTTLDGTGSLDPEGGAISFNWKLTSGIASADIQNASSQVTICSFTEPGSYQFTLTVTDDKGANNSASTAVTVIKPEISEKTCSTLTPIIEEFDNMNERDPENFSAFAERYTEIDDVFSFYKAMKDANVSSLKIDKQIDFFVAQKVSSRLVKWIFGLQKIIIEDFRLRLLALFMLQIHTELIYYIACIQKEDIDKAKSPMINPLEALIEVLDSIVAFVPNFSTDQKKVLDKIREITSKEKDRVFANGEDGTKPLYVATLDKIIAIIDSMPL